MFLSNAPYEPMKRFRYPPQRKQEGRLINLLAMMQVDYQTEVSLYELNCDNLFGFRKIVGVALTFR
jgi:hypothetical protein